MKFHIRTRLIESFRMIFRSWWCAEEKLHFTPVHTLRQLKRDEALFPPLGRVAEFRARYRQIPVRRFWGVRKIWRPFDLRSGSYKRLYTHTHTHTHAQSKAKSTAAAFAVTPPGYKSQVSCALRRIFGPALTNPPETGPVCTRRR